MLNAFSVIEESACFPLSRRLWLLFTPLLA